MVITDVNQVVYQGDGSTTAFPYTFTISEETVPIPIFGSADLKLLLINSDGTEQAITSDYYVDILNKTVHYPGYAPGSEPPLANQPPKVQTGQKLVIYRELPVTQERDLGDKWPFNPIEKALDKLTMLIQDWRDVLSRCLKVSVGSKVGAGSSFDPTIKLEADKVVCGNENGTGFVAREALMEVNGAWDGESRRINWVADPVNNQDAATKKYVDDAPDSVKYRIYEYIDEKLAGSGDGTFQYDHYLDLMPTSSPVGSSKWDIDSNGDIMPKEGVA